MRFKFLPFEDLETNTINLISKIRVLHEKSGKEIYNQVRQNQVNLLDGLYNNVRKLTEILGTMDDEYIALIATGAFLSIKEDIDKDYSNTLSKFMGYDPNREALYAGIDGAIGHTENNPLDKLSKRKAIAAFNRYVSMNAMKVNDVTNENSVVKDEAIKSLVTAHHKLKPVKTVEKIEKPRYEDSVNPTLLLANAHMVKEAQDKNTPVNTKNILNNLLSQYTRKDELWRYNKDDHFKLHYLCMNGYKLDWMSDTAPKLGEIHVISTPKGLAYKIGMQEKIENHRKPYSETHVQRDNPLGNQMSKETASHLLDELYAEKNAIYLIPWARLPKDFPRDFTSLNEIVSFIPKIAEFAYLQDYAIGETRLIQEMEQFKQKWLYKAKTIEMQSPLPGKVRDATSEEAMHYQMSDKKYELKKIPDKQPEKVLVKWKGEYPAEEKEKVKAKWKGVPSHSNHQSWGIALFRPYATDDEKKKFFTELGNVQLKKAATLTKVSVTPVADVDMDDYRENKRLKK